MNYQQFLESARAAERRCCEACGRNMAEHFDLHYVNEDGSTRVIPLCNRCYCITGTCYHWPDEDVIDEMVHALRERQMKRIADLVERGWPNNEWRDIAFR